MIIDNLEKFIEKATNDVEGNSSNEISDNELIDLGGDYPHYALQGELEPLYGEMEPDPSPFDIIDESDYLIIEQEKPETTKKTLPQDVMLEDYIYTEGERQ